MYNWMIDETDYTPVYLERIDPITSEESRAVIIDDKLDPMFRNGDGSLCGIVPESYVKQYKRYLKRIKDNG